MLKIKEKYHLNYAVLNELMSKYNLNKSDLAKICNVNKSTITRNFEQSERVVGDRMRDSIGKSAVKRLAEFLMEERGLFVIDTEVILYFLFVLATEKEINYHVVNNMYIAFLAYIKENFSEEEYDQAETISMTKDNDVERYNDFVFTCVKYIDKVNKINGVNPLDDDLAFYKTFRTVCMRYFDFEYAPNSAHHRNRNENEEKKFMKACQEYFALIPKERKSSEPESPSDIDLSNPGKYVFHQVVGKNKKAISGKAATHAKQVYLRCLFGKLAEELSISEMKFFIELYEKDKKGIKDADSPSYSSIKRAIDTERERYTIDKDAGVTEEVVKRLAEKLECSVDYLLGRTDKPNWYFNSDDGWLRLMIRPIKYNYDAKTLNAINKMFTECWAYADNISRIFCDSTPLEREYLYKKLCEEKEGLKRQKYRNN